MINRLVPYRFLEIVRFYQAGIVNMLLGLGLYFTFVRFGMNIFAAQIVTHILGMAFNYFTYSRHVFRESGPAKLRFVVAYIASYFVGLAALAVTSRMVSSPYLAGFLATAFVSVVSYFALKYMVFLKQPAR
jgi:putative flippase GtrA